MPFTLEQLEAGVTKLAGPRRTRWPRSSSQAALLASRKEVTAAWEAEIPHRIGDMDTGRTKWNSMEES